MFFASIKLAPGHGHLDVSQSINELRKPTQPSWRFKVGVKQLGPGVETGIHEVHDEKRVLFKVELQGAHGDREAEVFQVSNDDTAVAQRWLEDKQPKKKTNTDCLVKEQEKECQTDQDGDTVAEWSGLSKVFWAEDTTRSTDLVNRSPSSVIGFKKHIDMLEFFGWLASIKQGMLEPVKVKSIFLGYHESIVGDKLWRLDDVTSKVVLYMNMGFNESGEYMKTFIGYGVDTGSVHVLQGVEFEVKSQKDHTFEVKSQGTRDGHTNRYLTNPGKNHWEAVKWILKYLWGTVDVGLVYGTNRGNHVDVTGFVDSDYAKDPDKGRSITGYAFLVQGCVEAIWLRGLLEELGVELNTVAVNCDNQGAIHLSRNHVFHERTKHINVRYHFIREVLEAKTVKVMKVGTEHNAADALTKVVPGQKLQHCLELLKVGVG
ncbi:hypothetical protein Tco_1319519 [Tanacetum coccineum]